MRRTYHYEVEKPDQRVVEYGIPGVTGPILKHLGNTLKRFREFGHIDVDEDEIDDLYAGEGDPTALYNVDTLLQGTIPNCYKERVRLENVQSGNGGVIRYEIIWRQVSA